MDRKRPGRWGTVSASLLLLLICLLAVVVTAASDQDTTTITGSVVDTTPPAAVTDLTVTGFSFTSLTLSWTAPGDDGNLGAATEYDIRYSTSTITEANWDSATRCINRPTPQSAGSSEGFTVTGLSSGATYYFGLKTADEIPNWSDLSNIPWGVTSGGGGWGGGGGGESGGESGETSAETPAPADFECSSLSISPTEVGIGETVNITILITNTGEQSGSYQVILEIDGVAEVDSEVDIDAGDSEQVSFSISRDTAGIYSVDVNGLTGSFEVKSAPAPPVEPAPPVTPVEPTPASPINWWLIGGISAAVVVAGSITYLFFIRRQEGAAKLSPS